MRTRCGARVVRRARCGDAPNRLLEPLFTQRQDEEARLAFGPGDVAQHSGDDGVAVPRVNHPSIDDRSLAAILVRLVQREGDVEAEFGVGLQRRALAVQRARNMSAVVSKKDVPTTVFACSSWYPLRYPGGCPPIFLSTLFGHIPSNDLHIPFNTLQAPAAAHFVCCVCGRPPGARPFRMLCFLCRDSLRGKSLMNLDCRFVVVWPQRQTFVRLLLQLQNRSLLRADVRRY